MYQKLLLSHEQGLHLELSSLIGAAAESIMLYVPEKQKSLGAVVETIVLCDHVKLSDPGVVAENIALYDHVKLNGRGVEVEIDNLPRLRGVKVESDVPPENLK